MLDVDSGFRNPDRILHEFKKFLERIGRDGGFYRRCPFRFVEHLGGFRPERSTQIDRYFDVCVAEFRDASPLQRMGSGNAPVRRGARP